eukprot:scaffold1978_cov142-Skeletonema_marinoi.AAC.10
MSPPRCIDIDFKIGFPGAGTIQSRIDASLVDSARAKPLFCASCFGSGVRGDLLLLLIFLHKK